MRFRLVPISVTLDDLERPKCPSFRNREVLREVAAPTRNKKAVLSQRRPRDAPYIAALKILESH